MKKTMSTTKKMITRPESPGPSGEGPARRLRLSSSAPPPPEPLRSPLPSVPLPYPCSVVLSLIPPVVLVFVPRLVLQLLLGQGPRSEEHRHPLWPPQDPLLLIWTALSPSYRAGPCYKLARLLTAVLTASQPYICPENYAATSPSTTFQRQSTAFGDKDQTRRCLSWQHFLGH